MGSRVIAGLCAGFVCALLPFSASAQTQPRYPVKPVRLLVGFAPGGGSDILSRAVGQKLTQRWGQPVVTDNHAGAGGTIAMELAAKAAPDGYTLLIVSGSQLTNASLVTRVPYDILTTFAPITQMTSQPYVLLAHPSLPVKSVKELIALAKSKPGALNYGSSGRGSSAHLGMELLKGMAKIDMVHVPYKGAGQAMIDLLSGQVQLLLGSAVSAMPQVKARRLKALGVTSAKRSSLLPDLPAIAEAGLPGYSVVGWYGIVAPARTPPAIVQYVNQQIAQILASPDIREKFAADGVQAAPSTPAQFRETIAREIEKWTKVVAASGMKL
jgi:tripartite-type tricarboxylate transporter receptor subunit TctC